MRSGRNNVMCARHPRTRACVHSPAPICARNFFRRRRRERRKLFLRVCYCRQLLPLARRRAPNASLPLARSLASVREKRETTMICVHAHLGHANPLGGPTIWGPPERKQGAGGRANEFARSRSRASSLVLISRRHVLYAATNRAGGLQPDESCLVAAAAFRECQQGASLFFSRSSPFFYLCRAPQAEGAKEKLHSIERIPRGEKSGKFARRPQVNHWPRAAQLSVCKKASGEQ